MDRITAGLLIPGSGEPVTDGVVILDGAQITHAGPAAGAPGTPGARLHQAVTVLPGLWDCHGHFLGARGFDLAQLPLEHVAVRAARTASGLRAALNAGVTSVREVGGRATREQLRRDARVIKVCASGGVLSEVDDPVHQQFTGAELGAIVEVATPAERVVAAHCHGKPGIMAALEAGCAPSRTSWPTWMGCPATQPPRWWRPQTRTPQRSPARLIAGSPSRWAPTSPCPAATGPTPGTRTEPRTLGPQAPRSGKLAAGYEADLITVDADPLADISVLASPGHVTGVWTAGRQVKGAAQV
jgi:imidazolonepropionase-like amidohydrolase